MRTAFLALALFMTPRYLRMLKKQWHTVTVAVVTRKTGGRYPWIIIHHGGYSILPPNLRNLVHHITGRTVFDAESGTLYRSPDGNSSCE
jgi:hypothetical protein